MGRKGVCAPCFLSTKAMEWAFPESLPSCLCMVCCPNSCGSVTYCVIIYSLGEYICQYCNLSTEYHGLPGFYLGALDPITISRRGRVDPLEAAVQCQAGEVQQGAYKPVRV